MTPSPALSGLLALAAFLMVACNDEEHPSTALDAATTSSDPTEATTSRTPDVTVCPAAQDVCTFSLDLADAIARADFDEVRSMMKPSMTTCPGPVAGGLGGPFPLCAGAAAGEQRTGMRIRALGSDGGKVVAEPLREVRRAVLAGGQGLPSGYVTSGSQPRIIGLHCPIDRHSANCSNHFVLFLAGATHFDIVRGETGLKVEAVQFGNFARDAGLLVTGGDFGLAGDGAIKDGRFLPWRPNLIGIDTGDVKEDWLMAPSEISGVVVQPQVGPCPVKLILRVPEASLVQDPKGPEIFEVWLYEGSIGLGDELHNRTRPREVVLASAASEEHYFQIALDSSMLGGKLCAAETVGMVVWGTTAPKIAGYQVIGP